MATKPTMTIERLQELGPAKLAQLLLDEVAQNAGLKRIVTAALAGQAGPEAIAKLIDRRLSGLEKARSFVDWDKARQFRDDLQATVTTISGELGPAAPAMAIDRLLRFIATHETVFERADDSSGAIRGVYYGAIDDVGSLVANLSPDDADLLPERILAALGESSHGYLIDVARAVVPHLPRSTLTRWGNILAEWQSQGQNREVEPGRGSSEMTSQYRDIRQILAAAIGDLDGLIALEEEKLPSMQQPLAIASQLKTAGRLPEALDWVRRKGRGSHRHSDKMQPEQVILEAEILTAIGDKTPAQILRWNAFLQTLDPGLLRAHIAALPDFEDAEVLDRAFAHALHHENTDQALSFLTEWPRLDLAARLIVDRHKHWSGQDYYVLPSVAETLEQKYPLAASVLFRALLDDILARARSKAYPHAARYLAKLDQLGPLIDADPVRPDDIAPHTKYCADLVTAHARKSGFWALNARH